MAVDTTTILITAVVVVVVVEVAVMAVAVLDVDAGMVDEEVEANAMADVDGIRRTITTTALVVETTIIMAVPVDRHPMMDIDNIIILTTINSSSNTRNNSYTTSLLPSNNSRKKEEPTLLPSKLRNSRCALYARLVLLLAVTIFGAFEF